MKTTEILVKKTAIEVTTEDWQKLYEFERVFTEYCDEVECGNCLFSETCSACGDKSPGLILRMILGDLDD